MHWHGASRDNGLYQLYMLRNVGNGSLTSSETTTNAQIAQSPAQYPPQYPKCAPNPPKSESNHR